MAAEQGLHPPEVHACRRGREVAAHERPDRLFEGAHRVGVERWPEADPLDADRAQLGDGQHRVRRRDQDVDRRRCAAGGE